MPFFTIGMKKILIFSLAYYPIVGGAEVAIKEITDRVGDVEFDMVTLRFNEKQPTTEKIGNVNVYRVGPNSSYINKILFVPRAITMAMGLNNVKKYDRFWAVMTYMLFPIALMRIFWGNKTPYVLTLQDGDPFSRVFKRAHILPFLPLLKYGFRNAEKVQTISTFLAGWAIGMGFRGVPIVIPNGVDLSLFAKHFEGDELMGAQRAIGSNDGDVVLITTSRLTHKNGVDTVIGALPFLPSNFIFAVVGIGEEEKDLKILAEKLRVENRVKFLGFIPHDRVVPYLKVSNIFIRASRSEGMGNSFIEAMASGVPVIGTPVGGIVDFIKSDETGFFCEPNNPKNVSEVIQKVANLSSEQRNKIIATSQDLIKREYDWTKISENMAKILVF
ncbi:MAG: glycosyltransferase family 4 protein [Minisyncoccia bacterium]